MDLTTHRQQQLVLLLVLQTQNFKTMTFTYKKLKTAQGEDDLENIKRIEDSAFIPFDPANKDYQAYLAWVAEGNTPEAAD